MKRKTQRITKDTTKAAPALVGLLHKTVTGPQAQLRFPQIIIDAIPTPVFYKNTQGVYLGCNKAFEQFLGLPREKIIGKTTNEVLPQDVAEAHGNKDGELFAKGGIQHYESLMIMPDGKRHDVVVYKEAFSDARGGVAGMVGVVFDISDRKKMEGMLRDSRSELEIRVKVRTAELSKANEDLHIEMDKRIRVEEELKAERRLFIGGPTVVFKWKNEEGWPVEYISANAKEQFGYEPSDLTNGKIRYAQVIFPDDLDRVAEEVRRYSQEGLSFFEQEYRIVCSGGKIKWVRDFTVVVKDSDGVITHYHGYVYDITVRKQIEQRIRESELRYRTILDSMGDAIHVVDENLKILMVNKEFKQWNKELGLTAAMTGRALYEVFPFLKNEVRQEYQKVFKTGKAVVTTEVYTINKKQLHTQTRKIPIIEEGKVTYVLTVIRDITEPRKT
ncbi:MAG: PAS domain S-box protein [Candidatus Omnitrophota bacterium]|jgi:PAS domain S-box-containing protein|nr:MAG: PAS domain S-box protein [Candidatus Omnitrophota bacterium]